MKVALLGDSIRQIGYGLRVPALLGDDFEVYQPNDNCRFAKYTLRGMYNWAKDMEGCEIVHWNNGLWDICNLFGDGLFTEEEEYLDTMLRIARILVSRHKVVIFATTTPVLPTNPYNKNSDIDRYNQILIPKLKEMGIRINDLYTTVMSDLDRYIKASDMIHLTDEGVEVCARQVADVILDAAKEI
ncbi:MAG: SGNH/GDSL hydrolase family protein [Clostridia bacterium]|nr:SGNH/GDSL hydrolase family protein [Clostridia bacterium]